jgi:hypothetical protein
MLRPLRRLLTALSLMALPASLTFWARGHWTQDMLARISVTDDGHTLRETLLLAHNFRDILYLARGTETYQLFSGPATEMFRKRRTTDAGWRYGKGEHSWPPPRQPESSIGHFFYDPGSPLIGPAHSSPDPTSDPEPRSIRTDTQRLALPWWFLTLCSAILPALALRRRLRVRRRPPGTCPGCGYDLRASPVRCPECGRPTADAPASPAPLA